MGFVVEHNILKPDPQKVDLISKAWVPENVQELQSFLGLTQFYKNMLPHLAHMLLTHFTPLPQKILIFNGQKNWKLHSKP